MDVSSRRVVAALVAAVFSFALMQASVVPALGLLQRELHTTPTWAAWIISAFLLANAVLTPLLTRLGDLYGRRLLLVVVLVVYGVGMVGAAAAQDIVQLVVARVVQGAALAIVPLAFAILREALPARRLPFATGLVSSVVGAGAGTGLVLGGVLADVSWRLLFAAGAVFAAVSLMLVVRWVPRAGRAVRGRLDVPGAVLLGLGLLALLLALTEGPSWGWTSAVVLGTFAASAVLLVALVLVERVRRDPLIDVAELTDRPMLMTHAAAFLFGVGSYFFYLGLPAYAQLDPVGGGVGFGSSVTVAGLVMLPGALAIVPAGMAVGRLASALGPRWPMAAGFAVAVAGSVLIALGHASIWQHVVFYTLVGAGSGLAIASLPKLVADVVPPERTATANGINNIIRTVGGVVGSQLAAAVLASPTGLSDAVFTTLFWLAAGAFGLGAVVAPFAVRRAPVSVLERTPDA